MTHILWRRCGCRHSELVCLHFDHPVNSYHLHMCALQQSIAKALQKLQRCVGHPFDFLQGMQSEKSVMPNLPSVRETKKKKDDQPEAPIIIYAPGTFTCTSIQKHHTHANLPTWLLPEGGPVPFSVLQKCVMAYKTHEFLPFDLMSLWKYATSGTNSVTTTG